MIIYSNHSLLPPFVTFSFFFFFPSSFNVLCSFIHCVLFVISSLVISSDLLVSKLTWPFPKQKNNILQQSVGKLSNPFRQRKHFVVAAWASLLLVLIQPIHFDLGQNEEKNIQVEGKSQQKSWEKII